MDEPLVSIVTPVYNVAPYLRRCLDSLANQTHRNLEFVVVDDGSTDGSGDICDEYARRDRRFKAIHHERNRGNSAARNSALRVFSGDFVTFVDADDWIEPDMYAALLARQRQDDVDIVVCGYSKDYPDGRNEPVLNKQPVTGGVFDTRQALYYAFRRYAYGGITWNLWNKLYRRKVIEGLLMDENLPSASDMVLLVQIALKAKTFAYLEKLCHHYYQSEISLSRLPVTDLCSRQNGMNAFRLVMDLLQRHGVLNDIIVLVKRNYAFDASCHMEAALAQGDEAWARTYQGELRRYLPEYIATNQGRPEWIARMNRLAQLPL